MARLSVRIRPEFTFLMGFLGIFGIFQLIYYAIPEPTLYEIIRWSTANFSAVLINTFDGAPTVTVQANQLASRSVRLDIIRGCDGTASLCLLLSAILALRAPFKRTLIGLGLGTLLMYSLNQARIVGIFFVIRANPAHFDVAHGYVAPTFIILAASLFFLWWAFWAAPAGPVGPVGPGDEPLAETATRHDSGGARPTARKRSG